MKWIVTLLGTDGQVATHAECADVSDVLSQVEALSGGLQPGASIVIGHGAAEQTDPEPVWIPADVNQCPFCDDRATGAVLVQLEGGHVPYMVRVCDRHEEAGIGGRPEGEALEKWILEWLGHE